MVGGIGVVGVKNPRKYGVFGGGGGGCRGGCRGGGCRW